VNQYSQRTVAGSADLVGAATATRSDPDDKGNSGIRLLANNQVRNDVATPLDPEQFAENKTGRKHQSQTADQGHSWR
jgi:hypothetical protein